MRISSCKPVYMFNIESCVHPKFNLTCVLCLLRSLSQTQMVAWWNEKMTRASACKMSVRNAGQTAETFISRVTLRSESVTSPVNSISSYICERGEENIQVSFRWQRGTDNLRSGIISTPFWQYSNLMRHTVSARVSLCLTLSGARSICKHKGTQRKQ